MIAGGPRGLCAGGRPVRPQCVRRVPTLVHSTDTHQAGACRGPFPRSRTSLDRHVPCTLRTEHAPRDGHHRWDCEGLQVDPGQVRPGCGGDARRDGAVCMSGLQCGEACLDPDIMQDGPGGGHVDTSAKASTSCSLARRATCKSPTPVAAGPGQRVMVGTWLPTASVVVPGPLPGSIRAVSVLP